LDVGDDGDDVVECGWEGVFGRFGVSGVDDCAGELGRDVATDFSVVAV